MLVPCGPRLAWCLVFRLVLGLLGSFLSRSIRLEGVFFLGLPGTDVPLDVPWGRQSGWVAYFPVDVGLLLELQGSGRLYWQVSFFRGLAVLLCQQFSLPFCSA